MPKKKTTRRRSNGMGFTIPVAIALPMAQVGYDYWEDIDKRGFGQATRWMVGKLTGYYQQENYPDWRIRHMRHAALPLAIGFMIHKIASRLGFNRAIAATGIPFIRI